MITILVTGATGTVGRELIAALATRPGFAVRAGIHGRAPAAADSVEEVAFDWNRPDQVATALRGVDRLFLLSPTTEDQVAATRGVVDAARRAGVQRLVKLSVFGAEATPGFQLGRWHREIERAVEASGMAYTFLRPVSFMDNTLGNYAPAPDGALYLPWGSARVAFIDARDVAAVSAHVLTTDGHDGRAYALTGPAALGGADLADAIGRAAGRSIRYVDVPEDAVASGMAAAGLPGWLVSALLELHRESREGRFATPTDIVRALLDRAPRTFDEFARDRAGAWIS